MVERKEALHPLEGQYIIYKYTECDFESEGSAFALYQLKSGKMKGIFTPGSFLSPMQLGRGVYNPETGTVTEVNEMVLQKMKDLNIHKAYSVFSSKDFFGIPNGMVALGEETDKGELEQWCEWTPVCFDEDEYDLLLSRGIKVEMYHER